LIAQSAELSPLPPICSEMSEKLTEASDVKGVSQCLVSLPRAKR
jgi:hypothetical protein